MCKAMGMVLIWEVMMIEIEGKGDCEVGVLGMCLGSSGGSSWSTAVVCCSRFTPTYRRII